jgi:uncharacterized protein YecT (DUF1311 family)
MSLHGMAIVRYLRAPTIVVLEAVAVIVSSLIQLSADAAGPQGIQEHELREKIATESGCKVQQISINHLIFDDLTGDGRAEAIAVASTCNTGTAGPDVHAVFSRDSRGQIVELKIAEVDSKNYEVLFGNRNSDFAVEAGLLIQSYRDGTDREQPLVIKYKWNGRQFEVVSIEASPRYTTSYDCNNAHNEVERAVCYVEALAALDLELESIYQSLLRTLSRSDQDALRVEQRNWLTERNKRCSIYKSTERLEECYRNRISDLKKRVG